MEKKLPKVSSRTFHHLEDKKQEVSGISAFMTMRKIPLVNTFLFVFCMVISLQLTAQPVLIGTVPDDSDNFITFKGEVYFTGNNHLWKWANNNLVQVLSIAGALKDIISDDHYIYYTIINEAGVTLYRTTGTAAGNQLLGSLKNIYSLTPFKNELYFVGVTDFYGAEIWKTSGRKISLLKDINLCGEDGVGSELQVGGGRIYFVGIDKDHGAELWSSDGTAGGTALLKDIAPGVESSSPGFVFYNNTIYFLTHHTSGYSVILQKLTTTNDIDTLQSFSSSSLRLTVQEDRLVYVTYPYGGNNYLYVSQERNGDSLVFVDGGYGDDAFPPEVYLFGDRVLTYVCKPADAPFFYLNLIDINTLQNIPFEHPRDFYVNVDCNQIVKVKDYAFYFGPYNETDEFTLYPYIWQTDLDRSIVLDKLFTDQISTKGTQRMFELDNKLFYLRDTTEGVSKQLYYYDPVPIQTDFAAVTNIFIVDTLTNNIIAEISDGDTLGDYSISLNDWLNTVMVAEVTGSAGSVNSSGGVVNKNQQGQFCYQWIPRGGTNQISAYPCSLSDGKGIRGEALTISYTLLSAEDITTVYVVDALTKDTIKVLEDNDILGDSSLQAYYQRFIFRPVANPTGSKTYSFNLDNVVYSSDYYYPYRFPSHGDGLILNSSDNHLLRITNEVRLANGAYSCGRPYQARFKSISSDSITGFHLINSITLDTLRTLFDNDTINLGIYPSTIKVVASSNIPNLDIMYYESKRTYWYDSYKFFPGEDIITATPYLIGSGVGRPDSIRLVFINPGIEISSFELIDTLNNQVIRTLSEGDTIGNFNASVSSFHYDIKIIAPDGVSRVGEDSLRPFMASQVYNFTPFRIGPGWNRLIVTPYASNGSLGQNESINFFVASNDSISSFTVVDWNTQKDLVKLNKGDTLDLVALGTERIGIRANLNSDVFERVNFYLDDKFFRTQSPFLFGEYNTWPTKSYTLKAVPGMNLTPYDLDSINRASTIHFTIVRNKQDLHLVLVDANTNNDLDTLSLKDTLYTNRAINLRADFVFDVGSVRFYLNDELVRTENEEPFALAGDRSGNYNAWIVEPGTYKLTIVPYSEDNGGGLKGCHYTYYLTLIPPQDTSALSFVLVNASANTDIRSLHNNDIIFYDKGSEEISIRAVPTQSVGSILFYLNGSLQQTENVAPYALKGDVNGNYIPWNANYQTYILTANAYSDRGGVGVLMESNTITFEIKRPVTSTTDPEQKDIIFYPNPVADQITIHMGSSDIRQVGVEILNSEGQVFYQGQHDAVNGTLSVMLSDSALKTGMYFLKLQSDGEIRVFKVFKM